jgi:RND family efflux transporter MFP subunit
VKQVICRCSWCILSFILIFSAGCHSSSEDHKSETLIPSASVVPATRQPIAHELHLAGIFQPYQEVDVHGKVSGYIRRINVDIGDRVHQGETLAVLEVPELQAQVAGAEAGVHRSEQDITRLESEAVRAQAMYTDAHAAYLRLKKASEQQPGLIAEQELDDAAARDQSAAAQVDAAKSAISVAHQQLDVSKAERLHANTLSEYVTITAPFNGVVTMRYADTGALIAAGTTESTSAQPIVRLAQSDVLRLRMPVPEEDVALVREGSTVKVHIQATGEEFTGKVIRYTREVSTDTRTMLTEVDVNNPTLALTPGMYADVTFTLQQKDNALVVPTSAVMQGDQPSVLIVNNDHRIEKRNITLGIVSANLQEITSGLNPGDQVVVGGQSVLQVGEQVNPHSAHHNLVGYDADDQGGR